MNLRLMKPLSIAIVLLLASCACALGQAMPAAIRPITEQIGGGFSYARPDYGESYVKGFTVFADAMYHRRFGVEANFHDVSLLTPTHVGERSYLFGPIISIIHQDRMNVYGKAFGGLAQFEYKSPFLNPHTENYKAYALGGGIEFRLTPRINLRPVDIEEQWWPGWQPRGLSPFVATFGAAYSFK